MKSPIYTIEPVNWQIKAQLLKYILECSWQQGKEASFTFAENDISKVSINFDENKKKGFLLG